MIGAEAAAIEVRTEEGWAVRHIHGLSRDVLHRPLGGGDAPIASLASTLAEPLVWDDSTPDRRFDPSVIAQEGLRSFAAVALRVKRQVIGVLVVQHRTQRIAFGALEVDFLRKLGTSVSLALENVRLYEGQKNISDTLQRAILRPPKPVPGLLVDSLYRSATEAALVGGDFFDLFEVRPGVVGLTIGDVSGHGVEAATIASFVRDTLRAYALQGLPVGNVMKLTNLGLVRHADFVGFTTVLFALLDLESGAMRYCSAGHPPAMVRRADGRVDEMDLAGGPPLGVFEDVEYRVSEDHLDPHELLLLYTDGSWRRAGIECFSGRNGSPGSYGAAGATRRKASGRRS